MKPTLMIRAIRQQGMTLKAIAQWGRQHGNEFSAETLRSIIKRDSTRVSPSITQTLNDLYKRLCT